MGKVERELGRFPSLPFSAALDTRYFTRSKLEVGVKHSFEMFQSPILRTSCFVRTGVGVEGKYYHRSGRS